MEDVAPVPINPPEKLTIFRHEGCWFASQGEVLELGYKEIKLTCGSNAKLTSVVKAIKEKFGSRYSIHLDVRISDNPFVRQIIKTSGAWGIALDFDFIQKALDNPSEKQCSFCKSGAWYNPHVSCFECFKCGAHEVGNQFVKIRRRW